MQITVLTPAFFNVLSSQMETYAERHELGQSEAEGVCEALKTEMEEGYAADDLEIRYDLGYSQGSGASFVGNLDAQKIVKEMGEEEKYRTLFEACDSEVLAYWRHESVNYVHERSTTLTLDEDAFGNEGHSVAFWALFDELTEKLVEWGVAKNQAIYRQLCDAYEQTWTSESLGRLLFATDRLDDFHKELLDDPEAFGVDEDGAEALWAEAMEAGQTVEMPAGYAAYTLRAADTVLVLPDAHQTEIDRLNSLISMWDEAA